MNQQDRKEFEIVHIKIDDMRQDIVDLRREMSDAHKKTDESLRFIKENLEYNSVFKCISLGVHSSLSSVGLIATISNSFLSC